VNWANLVAAQGASGTDFYDRSILRQKHRAYYRSGRPVIKIGPKGALGSHETAQFTPLQASDRPLILFTISMDIYHELIEDPYKRKPIIYLASAGGRGEQS